MAGELPSGVLTLSLVAEVGGLSLCLWLGLYLALASGPRPVAARLASLAVLVLAGHFLLSALLVGILHGHAELLWQRWLGWVFVLAPALWMHLTAVLLPEPGRGGALRWARAAYLPAALLGLLAVFSDALYAEVRPPGLPLLSAAAPGPLYPLYLGFFGLLALAALRNLAVRYRTARSQRAREQTLWLWAATVLAAAGGAYLSLGTWLGLPWISLPGDLLLLTGVVALGVAMAGHQALLEGSASSRLVDWLAPTAAVTAAYLAVTYIAYRALELPVGVFVFVAPLAVLSHPLYHWLLERRAPSSREPFAPPSADKAWVDEVEEALRRLHDLSYLGHGRLAGLAWVAGRAQGVTHLDRGRVVAELLTEAVERLRPPAPETAESRAWQHYRILLEAYVEGQPTREVMNRLYISEATFHRYRRQAVESVAQAILELEDAARLG